MAQAEFSLIMEMPTHEHSPTQHRAFVARMLQQVAHAVASNYVDPRVKTGEHGVAGDHHSICHAQGDITTAPGGIVEAAVIGHWEIREIEGVEA